MRRLWGVLVVLLVLAGCTTERVGGDPDRTEAPTGPLDLEIPIELARVSPAAAGKSTDARTLPEPDGNKLAVDEPFLTITRLEHAKTQVEHNTGNWSLLITMTEEDGAVLSRWTAEHIGARVAMIADGVIVSAPMVQSPIPGREVTITARYTRDEAEALLNRITGR
ncbi:MAG: hypothetical protein GEV28_32370 [Actinophytocola sp.]|uniref:SecDF P1 head subdomain-containing protein n=1 Tax=Actinophytocola sp. TaxID=1872138 RepID=UPI00132C579F|nr:hypothetical protein [Actinophytocola sp.]MPZ84830.1 hypothetical protein [Actinophytocola sp.]